MAGSDAAAGGLPGALGRAVAGMRAERGWSLDALADRSGVSKGVLVAVEQGRSNPSLRTLVRIADTFGVPVTRLLEPPQDELVRVTGPDAARVLWRGTAGGTGTIIGATEPPWAAELWRFVLEPGDGFSSDPHAPSTRELICVGAGELTLTVAGRRYLLGAGQCARFGGDLPHSYANEGGARVSLTMVVVVPPVI